MSWWEDNPYVAPQRQRVGPAPEAQYLGAPEAVASPGRVVSPEEEAALRAQYPGLFDRPTPEMEKFGEPVALPQGLVDPNDPTLQAPGAYPIAPLPPAVSTAPAWGTPGYGGTSMAPPESGYGGRSGQNWTGLVTKALGGMYGFGGGSQRQQAPPTWGLSPRQSSTPYVPGRQSPTPYPGGSTLGSMGGLTQMQAPTGQTKWLDRRQADRYAALGARRL